MVDGVLAVECSLKHKKQKNGWRGTGREKEQRASRLRGSKKRAKEGAVAILSKTNLLRSAAPYPQQQQHRHFFTLIATTVVYHHHRHLIPTPSPISLPSHHAATTNHGIQSLGDGIQIQSNGDCPRATEEKSR